MAFLHPRTRVAVLGLIAAFCFSVPVISLNVISSSKCVAECGKRTNTLASDLVCPDSSYNTSADGMTMKNCLLCESTGTAYKSETENDVWSFLFNQKYTLQTCLFDRSADTSLSGCENSCLPLRSIFKNLWFKKNSTDLAFDYCTDVFTEYSGDCSTCLRGKSGSVILGNFMDTMNSACETKPNASEGEIVKLRRPLFDVSTATTTSTSTSTSTTSDTSSATGGPSSGLSTGAKAGIGVGVGVGGALLLGVLVWVLLLRKKKASKKVDGYQYEQPWEQASNAPTSGATGGEPVAKAMGELPIGARPHAELDTGKTPKGPDPVELA